MNITVYGGANEIGGNLILVESKNTKLVLDCGIAIVNQEGKTNYSNETKRKENTPERVKNLMNRKILPEIKGLFNDGENTKNIDAVFITHSHIDHYASLKFIRNDIPVYMGSVSEIFLDASLRFNISNGIKKDNIKLIENELNEKKNIEIGDFIIEPVQMDHSILDSKGYYIKEKTTGKNLFYTGDFRIQDLKTLDKFKENNPDCLITEGTKIKKDNEANDSLKTEEDVMKKISEDLKNNKNKFAFAVLSGQNIERLLSFYQAAINNNYRFVIDGYIAYILYKLDLYYNNAKNNDYKLFKLEEYSVFVDNSDKRKGGDKYINKFGDDKDYYKELLIKISKNKIKTYDINNSTDKFLIIIRDSSFKAIKELTGYDENSIVIYSMWEGYLQESTKLNDFINKMKEKGKYHYVHISGHSNIESIKALVKILNPKKLIPVHTLGAKYFKEIFSTENPEMEVKIPEKGETITI
jgi:ribonuclease J